MDRYSTAHACRNGPGDTRPTALQVVRDEQQQQQQPPDPNDHPLVMVVTGATSGIGFETARALYSAGAQVIISARDLDKGNKAVERIVKDTPSEPDSPLHDIQVVVLNLDSLALLGGLNCSFTLLDCLGIAAVPFQHTEDGLERNWGVNFVAPFLLTYLLLPRVRESSTGRRCGRIINVSSTGHRLFPTHLDDPDFKRIVYDTMSAYATSKLANIYHANYIDRHFSHQRLRAVSLHPGTVRETQLLRALAEPESTGPQVLTPATPGYAGGLKSAEQGAATIVFAAIASLLENKGGLYLENCAVGKQAPPDLGPMEGGNAPFALDEKADEDLWRSTCELLGLPGSV